MHLLNCIVISIIVQKSPHSSILLCNRVQNEMVIAAIYKQISIFNILVCLLRALFISFFKINHIFSKHLLTSFASKNHFSGFFQLMIIKFIVAFSTVLPFFATLSPDCHLSVKYVLAHFVSV